MAVETCQFTINRFPHLHLSVCPAGDFHDHVVGLFAVVGKERNVMQRRDYGASVILCGRGIINDLIKTKAIDKSWSG